MSPSPPLPPYLGAVLAGGASRRFGAPKALARLGGVPLATRVAGALRGTVARVGLVANDPAFLALGLETRADLRPGEGPLAGVETALAWAAEAGLEGVLCVACDVPFVNAPLLRAMAARAAAHPGHVVVPASPGRRGFEPLVALYPASVLPAVAAALDDGRRAVVDLLAAVPVATLPAEAVARAGDPAVLFLNVNSPDELRRAETLAPALQEPMSDLPPVLAVVGRKNSGKTTLTVALAAELKRRGLRVATLKHGHHAFEIDQPGRDTYRHFHEGGAEAVIMVGTGKVALVMRTEGDPDPRALLRRFYGGLGYDVVLVEGYKHGPFPRIEVFRRAVHDAPLVDEADGGFLAMVTDDPRRPSPVPVIPLADDGAHVDAVADLVENHLRSARDG